MCSGDLEVEIHKIEMQVMVVARPRNHEDPINTAILSDGGFFAW
jgi:hypothetical protein